VNLTVIILGLYNMTSFIIRVVMLCYVPLRHEPTTAMAWLLAINIWPWGGLILYSLFGSTGLPRERIERREMLLRELGDSIKNLRTRLFENLHHPDLDDHHIRISYLASRMVDMEPMPGNSLELIDDTEAFIDRLCTDIDGAKDYVNLLYYILSYDEVTERLFRSLKSAAGRGVECRMLVDAVGSKVFLKKHARMFEEAGIKIAKALPIKLLRRTHSTARYDIRNHRKIAVIDGKVGYAGSHNIIEPSYKNKAKGLHWHDLTLRLVGPAVVQLEGVFHEDWYVETHEKPSFDNVDYVLREVKPEGNSIVQVVPSGPHNPYQSYQRLIVAAILASKRQVTITTPYFIPESETLHALETASLMDVRVRLIVPERTDQLIVGSAARAYFTPLLDMGVDIYLYQGGIIHAKTVTIDDDLAFLGTSNFDIRSFALDFELDLILYGRDEASQILAAQERYIYNSRKLCASDWGKHPLLKRTFYGIAKLFSPLL
jgi:cardiolipin synthase